MKKPDWTAWAGKLLPLFQRYKFVLLVMLAGVVLLLLPGGGGGEETAAPESSAEAAFDLEAMEQKLAQALSEIDGAGEVHVVLTVKAGTRQIIAQDISRSVEESSSAAVIVSRGSGVEETVLLQQIYPQYQGALVVCPGGDDPAVQLAIAKAVSSLTGLGSDRISVCKSK